MKKEILKIAIIIGISLTYSCENQTKKEHNHKQTPKIEKADQHHPSKNNSLVLDNGNLWIANKETTLGVKNMINIIDSFTEKDNIKAYEKLTENLKAEFSMIFQKCTMTGKAHSQLHNFLVPIKNSLETLSSSDLVECQKSYSNLNKHLKKYKKYFK